MRSNIKYTVVSSSYIRQIVAVLVLVLPTATTAQSAEPSALAKKLQRLNQQTSTQGQGESLVNGNPTYKKMLKSVCLIELNDEGTVTHGTGWIVDAEQRLIVTNYHVIEGWLSCDVYFPEFVDGKLITDPDRSLDESRSHSATVVDSDEEVDLALIQLDADLPKDVVALELADESARPGQTIHSIAGSPRGSASLWIYSTGHARQVGRGTLANDYETQVLESDMATNQGNSGGPVCDDRGRVVAVVEGHRTDARLVSLYIDLQPLAEYLASALRCVDPQTVEDLQFAAERHRDDGRSEVAAKLATKAIKLAPKSSDLYALRGWCWCWLSDLDASQADFEEAVKLDPTNADAHCGLAELAAQTEEHRQEIKHLTNAIRNDPDTSWYNIDRGDAHRRLGEYDEARRDIQGVLDYEPTNTYAIKHMAMLELDLNNYDAGIQYMGQIIEDYDDEKEVLFYAAYGMQGKGDFETAYNLCVGALNIDPEYGIAHFQQGVALVSMERFKEAVAAFENADKFMDADANVKMCLGVALFRSGRSEEGKALVAKAYQMDPSNEAIKDVYLKFHGAAGRDRNATLTPNTPPNNLTRTQPVSVNGIPRKAIGDWSATVTVGSDVVRIDMTLRANGTYSGVFNMPGPDGRQDKTDSGAFAIRGNELVLHSNDLEEILKRPIRWRGNVLEMYMESFQAWVQFSRST